MTTTLTKSQVKNLEKTLNEVKEELYVRLSISRAIHEEEMPEWVNVHDYASGAVVTRKAVAKSDMKWLENLLDKIEKS